MHRHQITKRSGRWAARKLKLGGHVSRLQIEYCTSCGAFRPVGQRHWLTVPKPSQSTNAITRRLAEIDRAPLPA
jgi:hypothetical protein